MLKSLRIRNLTAFAAGDLEFSPQLNVIVGENAVGKTHLLKVPYAILATSAEAGRKLNGGPPTKATLQARLSDKLVGVLRPESIGRLARRTTGVNRCEIKCRFDESALDLDFHFTSRSQTEVVMDRLPSGWVDRAPVFLPTRELLTIYPGFVSVYENHYLEFEETWRDTCILLGAPAIRGPKEKRVRELLGPLENAMGGKVELDRNGRFYLNTSEQGRMEMPLVAEGCRKLAMIARLIATGSLLDKGYLFWDEPETNLNPKLIKEAARTILHLCRNGIQVFIATHSLFLMRELDILLQSDAYRDTRARYIGLQAADDGVLMEQGDSVDDIGAITALDEELSQSDRYLGVERDQMPEIKEGALTFQFPDSWEAVKLDGWSFYRNQFIRLGSGLRQPCGECGAELRCENCGTVKTQGIKAVDILARDAAATLWLLEVKDYRQSPRRKEIGLADEVALKVRDSLALLVAAAMSASDPKERLFARDALTRERICIGLHLEQPKQRSKLFPRAIKPSVVQQKLRQLVRSIDPHPRVFEMGTNVTTPWTVN